MKMATTPIPCAPIRSSKWPMIWRRHSANLCSQSTISRLENLPDARALLRAWAAPLVDLYCETFSRVPKRITLDIDDTFDAVHGAQQLRLFNAHYDEYGFQPIVVFDGEGRFITAVLRPAKRPSGKENPRVCAPPGAHNPYQLAACRNPVARVTVTICCPEVLDFCRVNKIDYILGVAPTSTLRSHILDLEATREGHATRPTPKQGKDTWFQGILRRRQKLEPRRAGDRTGRGWRGGDRHALHRHKTSTRATRAGFMKTSIAGVARPRTTSSRGRRIWRQTARPARRPLPISFRLFLHAGAYWLMWGLRQSMPRRSRWRVAQFDTLRLRLVKIAARRCRDENHDPGFICQQRAPARRYLRFALERIPRLVT